MVCAACQAHVQKALDETQGVSKAAVNLMTGQARVSFDPQIVEPGKLLEAIRETGYEAALPLAGQTAVQEQRERDREQSSEARNLAVKAAVSFVAGRRRDGRVPHTGCINPGSVTRWPPLRSS